MRLSWGPGAAALLLLAGTIVYLNALVTPFQFNDYFVVVNDSSIKDLSNLRHELAQSLRTLTKLSYALNYAFGGLDPSGYHLVNLWFHLFTALEVFYLAGKVMPNPAPFWIALIFTVHPIQTETVTYIAARSNVMMGFFYISGLLAAIHGLASWETGKKGSLKAAAWFGVALLSYLAAVASKEAAITLPLLVIAYDLYFLRKDNQLKRVRNLLYVFSALLALGIFGLLLLQPRYFQLFNNIFDTLLARSLGAHVMTQTVITVALLGRFILPINLNIDPDFRVISALDLSVTFSFLLLLSAFALALRLYRRLPVLSFAFAWFFITLLPHLLLPRSDFISERHLYLPSVGLLIGVIYLVFKIRRKIPVLAALGIVALLLGIGTIQRNRVYADETTFWLDAVSKSPNKGRPHNNLGYTYLKQGDLNKAAGEFERALEIDPSYRKASLNLGYIYILRGDTEKARQVYLKALAFDPSSADLQKALAQLSTEQQSPGGF